MFTNEFSSISTSPDIDETGFNRTKASRKLSKWLHRVQADNYERQSDIFSLKEADKRKLLTEWSVDHFLQFLTSINGILRDKERDEWQIDGRGVEVRSMFFVASTPPRENDKLDLVKNAFVAAQAMNLENRPLTDIGFLLGFVINEVHLFKDANGRISRLVRAFFSDDEFTAANFYELLSSQGRREGPNIDNFGLVQPEFDKKFELIELSKLRLPTDKKTLTEGGWQPKDLQFQASVSKESKEWFFKTFTDDRFFMDLTLLHYVTRHGTFTDYAFKEFDTARRLLIRELIPKFNEEAFEEIENIYWNYKKKHVQFFVDGMLYPDEPEYQMAFEGANVSLPVLIRTKRHFRIEQYWQEQAQLEKLRKESAEAREKQLAEEEISVMDRFNRGEGQVATISDAQLQQLKIIKVDLEAAWANYLREKVVEDAKSEQEKRQEIQKIILEIWQLIEPSYVLTSEQLAEYTERYFLEKEGRSIADFYHEFHLVGDLLKKLNLISYFHYRFTTTSNTTLPKTGGQLPDNYNVMQVVHDCLKHSVYFMTGWGSSLRIKLFDITSGHPEQIIQPVMQKIFFKSNDNYESRKVIRLNEEQPKPYYFVFEISSSGFFGQVNEKLSNSNDSIRGIRFLETENDGKLIYLEVKPGDHVHPGWFVRNISELI